MFQKTVYAQYAAGVRGEIAADGPLRSTTFRLLANAAVPIMFGSAFTHATPFDVFNPNGLADVPTAKPGGDGVFAGILIHPKEHALSGNASGPLTPVYTLPEGEFGNLVRMGIIFAEVTCEAGGGVPGASLAFDQATGEIVSYVGTLPAAHTAIPGSLLTNLGPAAVTDPTLAIIELTGSAA